MPSHKELRKKSDEHKAILAQKCVDLLMRKPATLEEATDVSVCGSDSSPAYTQQLYHVVFIHSSNFCTDLAMCA